MKISRPIRITLISLGSFAALLILLAVLAISKIDRNINYQSLLDTMDSRIKAVGAEHVVSQNGFKIGFAKVNLTPSEPLATAGPGKRMGKLYTSVHDSIYARAIVVDNGNQRVAIVSADLLIIPPTVTALLEKNLPEINFSLDNTFLGATHTHNSIGNWATGITSLMYGIYEDSVVSFIAAGIQASILKAAQNMLPATVRVDSVAIPEAVYNRITDGGPVDPLLRMVEIVRSDSSKLLLTSYTAHATCLSSRDLTLSGDYPGKLIQLIESQGFDFAMFMAGAVGSHGPNAPDGRWECVDWMAETVASHISHAHFKPTKTNFLEMHRVPLELPQPQAKVMQQWRLRPWLFKTAFGEYPTFVSVLRLGDIVLLGTPADFSGEFNFSLDSLAASVGVFPIVTSFNGGYIGYLTPEKYYDIDHYETQLMSWYGPGNGEYVKKSLERLLLSVAD